MQPADPQQPLGEPPSSYNPAPQPLRGNAPQSPYGAPQGPLPGADKKILAGVLGILLGAFGVHKFVLGYTNTGIIMLAITLVGGMLSFGIISGVMGIIGLIEGIIYLTKTDEGFVQEYVQNKKQWF